MGARGKSSDRKRERDRENETDGGQKERHNGPRALYLEYEKVKESDLYKYRSKSD